MRLGYKDPKITNYSETINGELLGNIIPPDPTQMKLVSSAIYQIRIEVALLPILTAL